MSGDDIRPGTVDAYLDPPAEPEWTQPVDIEHAPLSAILRAGAAEGFSEELMSIMAKTLGEDMLRDVCAERGIVEVVLTEEEWREAFPPHNPFDPRL